jgi:hypothetical protein
MTLMEQHRMRVFGKRVLGPKRNEIICCWIKMHNEELHNLPSAPNIIITIQVKEN